MRGRQPPDAVLLAVQPGAFVLRILRPGERTLSFSAVVGEGPGVNASITPFKDATTVHPVLVPFTLVGPPVAP